MTKIETGMTPAAEGNEQKAERPLAPETVPESGDGRDIVTGTAPATEVEEVGGPAEREPTRYGDWVKKGRCIDF